MFSRRIHVDLAGVIALISSLHIRYSESVEPNPRLILRHCYHFLVDIIMLVREYVT